jgi:Antitoxin to bacterial toxin RNase LS or RnlA
MCYQIQQIDDVVVVVYSTSYKNPIAYLKKIEEDLDKIEFKGEVVLVIFDLLLCNGYSSNRFIQAEFFNRQIDRLSIKVLKNIDSALLEKSQEFYQENQHFLENSIL